MTTKKKPTTKKSTTKKRTVAASHLKKTVSKSNRAIAIEKEDKPFLTVKLTKQSLYWLLFLLAVLAVGLWAIGTSDNIQYIFDKADTIEASK